MRIVTDIEQGSPEWFDLKAGVISASEFDVVMGRKDGYDYIAELCKYKHGTQGYKGLIARKATERITGRYISESKPTYAMSRGHEREDQARAWYEMTFDVDVEQVAFIYMDGDLVGCSPDGLVGGDGMVEIKSPMLMAHLTYLMSKGAPDDYKWQLYGQLWVAERDWVDFVTFCPESHKEAHRIRIYRDDKIIKDLETNTGRALTDVDAVMTRLQEAA